MPSARYDASSEANVPLISPRQQIRAELISSRSEYSALSFPNASKTIQFLTFSAGLSGLLFGFDTASVSATLVSIGSDLSGRQLTTSDKSLITAITSLLALIFAPLTGIIADQFGRRSSILLPAILFIAGALVQSIANCVWIMVVGRGLVGAAVGIASGAVPLYITELAPAEMRGRLVTIQSLFVTGGQVVAYLVGFSFASAPHGWRWMVGLGALPAALQLLLLLWMPETPRWLIQAGREPQAREILSKVYHALPDDHREAVIEQVFNGIKDEIAMENKIYIGEPEQESGNGVVRATRDLFATPGNRRALIIACLLQAAQQACGFNSLMYFSASIFALVGFTSPVGTSLSIAITNFTFTLAAFAFIDRVGRRNILLRSIPLMIIGLLSCSVAFEFIPLDIDQTPTYHSAHAKTWPIVLLVSMTFYVASYAIGIGCVPWQQSELFTLRVRSLGSGLATATNWSCNFIIGLTFLPMMESLGPSPTFALYAFVCMAGWLCIWRIYPETAGLELEDIGELLKDGWNVQESMARFRERRKIHDIRFEGMSD